MGVIIVGAGPTGLLAANLLGQAGIETLVIERQSALSAYPRAITLDDEGWRICQMAGLDEPLKNHLQPDLQAHYISHGRLLARVAPSEKRNGYPLISTFHQPALEAIFLAGLARYTCVKVLFGHTVETCAQTADVVRLDVRTTEGTVVPMIGDYALACDGGRSTLRQALGITLHPPRLRDAALVGTSLRQQHLPGKRRITTQKWLVVDMFDDEDDSPIALFFCNPQRPAVTLPAPGCRRRWEFMLLPGERDEDVCNDEMIQSLIQQARATQEGTREVRNARCHIIRKAVYSFHTARAARFVHGRILLVGDAAHLMPPFGGQGMNSGLRDAANLCWKLTLVLQGSAAPPLLESYQQERFPHVAQMMLFSSLVGQLVMTTTPLVAWLRDRFFLAFTAFPSLRVLLTEMKVKPLPRYRYGCLLPAQHKAGRSLVGTLMPQPLVLKNTGESVLLDEVLATGFAVLRLSKRPAEAFEALTGEIWQQLNVRRVSILPDAACFQPVPEAVRGDISVVDSEGKIAAFLHSDDELYILLRPDRYILAAFRVEHAVNVGSTIRAILWYNAHTNHSK